MGFLGSRKGKGKAEPTDLHKGRLCVTEYRLTQDAKEKTFSIDGQYYCELPMEDYDLSHARHGHRKAKKKTHYYVPVMMSGNPETPVRQIGASETPLPAFHGSYAHLDWDLTVIERGPSLNGLHDFVATIREEDPWKTVFAVVVVKSEGEQRQPLPSSKLVTESSEIRAILKEYSSYQRCEDPAFVGALPRAYRKGRQVFDKNQRAQRAPASAQARTSNSAVASNPQRRSGEHGSPRRTAGTPEATPNSSGRLHAVSFQVRLVLIVVEHLFGHDAYACDPTASVLPPSA